MFGYLVQSRLTAFHGRDRIAGRREVDAQRPADGWLIVDNEDRRRAHGKRCSGPDTDTTVSPRSTGKVTVNVLP